MPRYENTELRTGPAPQVKFVELSGLSGRSDTELHVEPSGYHQPSDPAHHFVRLLFWNRTSAVFHVSQAALACGQAVVILSLGKPDNSAKIHSFGHVLSCGWRRPAD
jgi:hypothetical protein